MFGDIVDTSSAFPPLAEIDLGDVVGHKEYVEGAIVGGGPESHRQTFKGPAHFEIPAKYRDSTSVSGSPDQVVWAIFHWWQCFGEGARAHLVAAGRDGHFQGFVRPFQVVQGAPGVEGPLALGQVSESSSLQHLCFEGSGKAFIFPLGLGMVGSTMANRNAQPEQPDRQTGIVMILIGSPRRPVVHHHTVGQAVASEDGGEALLHGLSRFVRARLQSKSETRVVIQHGEWMTSPCAQREVALKVHLPQLVYTPWERGADDEIEAGMRANRIQ